MSVLGDADYRAELLPAETVQPFADGILSGPVVICQALADDDHRNDGSRVALLEAAPPQYPRAERAKIVRRHELQVGVGIRRVLCRRFALGSHPAVDPAIR